MIPVYEALIDRRTNGLPVEALSEVYARLIWCIDDNGAEICSLFRQWLDGEDAYRIEVALALDEVWLFDTQQEMAEVLTRIRSKFPALIRRCDEHQKLWRR